MFQRPARVRPWLRTAPAIFTMAWGGNHFTPLLHLYEVAGNYTVAAANLLLGMYVFGLIPGLLVAAAISDRHGRKPTVIAGMSAALAASVICSASLHNFPLLCIGRVLAGVAVGIAMAVGTSWMKELSSTRYAPAASASAGARRPALTLTLGFALGAGVTGFLAQWGPMPTVTPYLVHAALCIPAIIFAIRAPETRRDIIPHGHWWEDLRVPSAGHRDFLRLIVPAAPWVFAAAGVAYAIMPQLVNDQLGNYALAYATILTVATLGTGALFQGFVPAINRLTKGRALTVGLATMSCGMALAALASILRSPVLSLVAAIVLGAAYGVTVVAGLIEIQKIATPDDLAGMTGLYYSLTYLGFLLPALLATVSASISYPVLLSAVTVITIACTIKVAGGFKAREAG